MSEISFDDFLKVDVRVGMITNARIAPPLNAIAKT